MTKAAYSKKSRNRPADKGDDRLATDKSRASVPRSGPPVDPRRVVSRPHEASAPEILNLQRRYGNRSDELAKKIKEGGGDIGQAVAKAFKGTKNAETNVEDVVDPDELR